MGDLIPVEFDDDMFEDDGDTWDGPDHPDFRAVVRRSSAVGLVHWGPWLQSTGPAYTLMAARDRAGVATADLRIVRDDEATAREVIVQFHSGGGEVHRAALAEWANAVGYTRVWFDGEVVDLEPAADGPVTTRCSGCGQQFVDGRSRGFWHQVHGSGAFPSACSLCGSDLPQWTPMRERGTRGTDQEAARSPGAARHGKAAHRR